MKGKTMGLFTPSRKSAGKHTAAALKATQQKHKATDMRKSGKNPVTVAQVQKRKFWS
jgi:hypothetical protein